MALSWSEQILPAGSQFVNVEMAYLDRSYIHVYLNDVEVTDFTWVSDTRIRLDAQLTEATTVTVVRRTDRSFLYILFAEGAAFIKENLDTQNTQFLHLSQELVEGRAIDGFFGEVSMNGYKITNLAPGTALTDAANFGQVQEVSDRVTSLEQNFVIDATSSYPWYTITTAEVTSFTPPFAFTKAAVYLNGVCQTPGYSYSISDGVITLADPVPAGTHIFCRLGEDVPNEQGYATAASLAAAVTGLEASVPATAEAAVGPAIDAALVPVNSAIAAKLDAATGNAASATKLATARTFRTDLATASAASFDGTSDAAPGVTGILTLANGGTGGSSAPSARLNLGLGTLATQNAGAAVADAASSVTTANFNSLLASLRAAGIIAT